MAKDEIDQKLDEFFDENAETPTPEADDLTLDDIEDEPATPANAATPTMVEPPEYELGELSDEPAIDVLLKEEDRMIRKEDKEIVSKNTFIIESVNMQEHKLKSLLAAGEQPQVFNPKRPEQVGFATRLAIAYKDSTYTSIIPNIRWYYPQTIGKGKKILSPWFNRSIKESDLKDSMVSTISKLYYRYCVKVGKEVGKVTPKEFVDGLVGMEVRLVQWSTTYNNKESYRLDIEFV